MKGDKMAQCKLSDRQRDLLRMIADGLKARPPDGNRNRRQWWIRMAHDHGLPTWQDVTDPDVRQQLQDCTELGDLVMFEKCGFIENAEPGRYFLIEARILDAVENDFSVSYDRSYMKRRSRKSRDRQSRKSKKP
jgi:hypothetical protein